MSLPILHLPGFHASLFPRIWPKRELLDSFCFTPNCRYDLGDDQWDWNKLCGLDFTRPFGLRKAVMVGWRWNPIRNRFELALYAHDPAIGRAMSEPLARVCEHEPFGIRLWQPDERLWRLDVWQRGEWSSFDQTVTFNETLGRPVSGWFGGDKPAPHFMLIDRGPALI